jgi:hypothetical protein
MDALLLHEYSIDIEATQQLYGTEYVPLINILPGGINESAIENLASKLGSGYIDILCYRG